MSQLVGSPGSTRKMNAFELIKAGLDISSLFEAREDVMMRHTRFSSRAPLATILAGIENAAVAVGGRVMQQGDARCGQPGRAQKRSLPASPGCIRYAPAGPHHLPLPSALTPRHSVVLRRLRLYIPNPKGKMQVLVEVTEVLPGTHMVDLQKVQGNTAEFHKWYSDLCEVLSTIISKKQPGAAGDVGAAAAARRRQHRESNGQLRTNAFQLISGCFNVSPACFSLACAFRGSGAACLGLVGGAGGKTAGGGLLVAAGATWLACCGWLGRCSCCRSSCGLNSNVPPQGLFCLQMGALFEEECVSQHVQFSSRRPPGEILEALEGAAQDLGGSMHRLGDRRAVLTMPVGGGRSMKLQAHLFEVLAGIHVCQIAKDAGAWWRQPQPQQAVPCCRLSALQAAGVLDAGWLCGLLCQARAWHAGQAMCLGGRLDRPAVISRQPLPLPGLLLLRLQAAAWTSCAATGSWQRGCSPS